MNLLILVVAVFAIISFFLTNMGESLKVKELNDLVSNNSIIISSMLSSPAYCDSLQRFLPESIKFTGTDLSYVMRIKISEITVDGEPRKIVIFSASDRQKPKQVLASSSFGLDAESEVKLYTNDSTICSSGDYCEATSQEIFFDPQARVPTNSFWAVKELEKGITKLYIVQCTFTSGITSACNAAKTEVGEKLVHIASGNTLGGFKC